MAIVTRSLDYEIDEKQFEGYIASSGGAPRPGVILCHAWAGRSEFENGKADALSKLGYIGVAVDLFGKGVLGTSKEENQQLIKPYIDNRVLLQSRLNQIVKIVREQPEVNADKIAAIGFCFGGLCVLDLARSGSSVKGVVSFHGLLGAPGNTVDNITAKILALHGWDDPMAPPSDVEALGKELSAAGADWQLHAYGNTLHAFTNPQANDPGFGAKYDATADRRSWQAMTNFLGELF